MPPSAMREALVLLGAGRDLTVVMSRAAVSEILENAAEPVPIAAFLSALRIKGEVADELTGAVLAVRERMTPLEIPFALRPILDTCGTGGDGVNSVNISTAAAIVVASCGVRVAKHGNRSASGNSGSAEVLAELGVRIDPEASTLIRCLEELGITFLFAPQFHPTLKHVAPIRRQLPFRTLFNLIGPLVNPARPDHQIIGTPDRLRTSLIAQTLSGLGKKPGEPGVKAFIVAGANDLDEVSLSGENFVESVGGPTGRRSHVWVASDFDLPHVFHDDLSVTGPAESARKIRGMLSGERGPVRDVILANAAAALVLSGAVPSLIEGVARAAEAVDRGDASRLLDRWAELSHA